MIGRGNVQNRPARPHPAYPRFVAVLDVLGMKEWLKQAGPQQIAERLDEALVVACDQSSRGKLHDGREFGPLISTTHFSDTVLAWSPDDSWASFAMICTSVKMIVAVALKKGVPLRGAISVGDAVCNTTSLRFVGPPITDAYLWSERDPRRRYRSVGVDLTPITIAFLQARVASDPISVCWDDVVPQSVIERKREHSRTLMWFRNGLFLNHWDHAIFTMKDPRTMFRLRNLPGGDDVTEKESAMLKFCQASRTGGRVQRDSIEALDSPGLETFEQQQIECLALDEVRRRRVPF